LAKILFPFETFMQNCRKVFNTVGKQAGWGFGSLTFVLLSGLCVSGQKAMCQMSGTIKLFFKMCGGKFFKTFGSVCVSAKSVCVKIAKNCPCAEVRQVICCSQRQITCVTVHEEQSSYGWA